YRNTLRSRSEGSSSADTDLDEVPEWMDDWWDETATYDDEALAEAEDDALDRARPLQPDADETEESLLEQMHTWALTYEAQPDTKARKLIDHLKAICKPDKHWTNERVVVFTEYRDTQSWLRLLLAQAGLDGEQVKELHGGMPTEEREALRVAFQKHPSEHPLRILIATDAAGEGID